MCSFYTEWSNKVIHLVLQIENAAVEIQVLVSSRDIRACFDMVLEICNVHMQY